MHPCVVVLAGKSELVLISTNSDFPANTTTQGCIKKLYKVEYRKSVVFFLRYPVGVKNASLEYPVGKMIFVFSQNFYVYHVTFCRATQKCTVLPYIAF